MKIFFYKNSNFNSFLLLSINFFHSQKKYNFVEILIVYNNNKNKKPYVKTTKLNQLKNFAKISNQQI